MKGGLAPNPAPARAPAPNPAALETYDIFIIMGQSNSAAAGSRNHDNTDTPIKYGAYFDASGYLYKDDKPDNRIKTTSIRLTNNYDIMPATMPIPQLYGLNDTSIRQPIQGTPAAIAGLDPSYQCNPVGFFLTFAKEHLLLNPCKKVLLIGCCRGATGMFRPSSDTPHYFWRINDNPTYQYTNPPSAGSSCVPPPSTAPVLVKSLYQWSLSKITAAATHVHPNSKVLGVLWHQGESDADPCGRSQYRFYVNELFTQLRSDIKRIFPNSLSNVPILMGGLCPDGYRSNRGPTATTDTSRNMYLMNILMRDTITNRAHANYITNTYYVSTDPIARSPFTNYLEGDSTKDASGNVIKGNHGSIHFSATSQREFGKRYYYIFNKIPVGSR